MSLQLLPNLHLAQHYATRGDGSKIFILPNRKLVCEHGESASVIGHFVSEEKMALAANQPPPPRGARSKNLCTCQSTHGLSGRIDTELKIAPVPSSLYEFLEDKDASFVELSGKKAFQIHETLAYGFVTPYGKICCKHGLTRGTIKRNQKRGGKTPCCDLLPFPKHTGFKRIPLGIFSAKIILVKSPVVATGEERSQE